MGRFRHHLDLLLLIARVTAWLAPHLPLSQHHQRVPRPLSLSFHQHGQPWPHDGTVGNSTETADLAYFDEPGPSAMRAAAQSAAAEHMQLAEEAAAAVAQAEQAESEALGAETAVDEARARKRGRIMGKFVRAETGMGLGPCHAVHLGEYAMKELELARRDESKGLLLDQGAQEAEKLGIATGNFATFATGGGECGVLYAAGEDESARPGSAERQTSKALADAERRARRRVRQAARATARAEIKLAEAARARIAYIKWLNTIGVPDDDGLLALTVEEIQARIDAQVQARAEAERLAKAKARNERAAEMEERRLWVRAWVEVLADEARAAALATPLGRCLGDAASWLGTKLHSMMPPEQGQGHGMGADGVRRLAIRQKVLERVAVEGANAKRAAAQTAAAAAAEAAEEARHSRQRLIGALNATFAMTAGSSPVPPPSSPIHTSLTTPRSSRHGIARSPMPPHNPHASSDSPPPVLAKQELAPLPSTPLLPQSRLSSPPPTENAAYPASATRPPSARHSPPASLRMTPKCSAPTESICHSTKPSTSSPTVPTPKSPTTSGHHSLASAPSPPQSPRVARKLTDAPAVPPLSSLGAAPQITRASPSSSSPMVAPTPQTAFPARPPTASSEGWRVAQSVGGGLSSMAQPPSAKPPPLTGNTVASQISPWVLPSPRQPSVPPQVRSSLGSGAHSNVARHLGPSFPSPTLPATYLSPLPIRRPENPSQAIQQQRSPLPNKRAPVSFQFVPASSLPRSNPPSNASEKLTTMHGFTQRSEEVPRAAIRRQSSPMRLKPYPQRTAPLSWQAIPQPASHYPRHLTSVARPIAPTSEFHGVVAPTMCRDSTSLSTWPVTKAIPAMRPLTRKPVTLSKPPVARLESTRSSSWRQKPQAAVGAAAMVAMLVLARVGICTACEQFRQLLRFAKAASMLALVPAVVVAALYLY